MLGRNLARLSASGQHLNKAARVQQHTVARQQSIARAFATVGAVPQSKVGDDAQTHALLERLGISPTSTNAGTFVGGQFQAESGANVREVYTPIDGSLLTSVYDSTEAQVNATIAEAAQAQLEWRSVPAPVRGELVRRLGESLRAHKDDLGALVGLEVGKITSEGLGEVQEMIDMADLAVGMSRQLCGLTMQSERVQHRMMESWHPLGTVGIISAFNFPVAVWAWNATVALVCGNSTVWKPSEASALTALACQRIAVDVCKDLDVNPALFGLVTGAADPVGHALVQHDAISLVSATGSTRMGKEVAVDAARAFKRTILELGGNNALIVTPSANLELTERAVLFGAVGTAGQRCTSTRRLIVHRSILSDLSGRLSNAYQRVRVGDPRDQSTLLGPVHSPESVQKMLAAVDSAQQQGGTLLTGGRVVEELPGGRYVEPALIAMPSQTEIVHEETFAPILYIIPYGQEGSSPAEAVDELDEAIALQNAVPQGLSSALFSDSVREAERFVSAVGSDCGIANVNLGTSGAEIGGAFGGHKDTGHGSEAGSDSWRQYMRRQTSTTNYGKELPLA